MTQACGLIGTSASDVLTIQMFHALRHFRIASATCAYWAARNECVPSTTMLFAFIESRYRRTASKQDGSLRICPALIRLQSVPEPVSVYGSFEPPSTYQWPSSFCNASVR